MRFAVNQNGTITNLIVAAENQQAELEDVLGFPLVDASTYALQVGDFWVEGMGWARNVDGEQVILKPLSSEERKQYNEVVELSESLQTHKTRVADLEKENKLLKEQVSALTSQMDFQEDCLVEMAEQVYA